MNLKNLSVAMLTKNSDRYLERSLLSLKDVGEVVLLDNGSTDQTQSIASQFENVRFYQHPFQGFGFMKNKNADLASFDWILTLDSDEIITSEALDELKNWSPSSLNEVGVFPRYNHYRGKWIKACDWHPDFVVRLYNKKSTAYTLDPVHEKIKIESYHKKVIFKFGILHYSFDSISDLINKMNLYSSLYAEEHKNNKKSGILKAVLRCGVTFLKNFFLKKGFLYGYAGFVISVCQAGGVFFKYAKLYENQKSKKNDG